MNALFDQLGINWKLFLSQVVNFFILLVVLTVFVYKPLIKVIKKRNDKIKEGLEKAEEADVRLKQVDEIGKEKIKEAEQQGINIIKDTEKRAKILEQDLQKKSEEKQKDLSEKIQQSIKKQEEEASALVLKNAVELVKKTIAKTIELKPEAVDEALIKKAVSNIKDEG